jgi:tetratricopeptide (TPR) repeat protein
VLEDARTWHALLGSDSKVRAGSDDEAMLSFTEREIVQGHVAHARSRIPGEPRWRLAAAMAQASRDLGSFDFHEDPLLVGNQFLRDEPPLGSASSKIPRVAQSFTALKDEPALAGEAEVRVGLLEMRRRRWADALPHLRRGQELSTEPFLRAVAHYLSGWASERLGRSADALASYRQAVALAPAVRNLSTLLAAQLFLGNERAEAYRILDVAVKANPPAPDLITLFERGDARLVPSYLNKLREALR